MKSIIGLFFLFAAAGSAVAEMKIDRPRVLKAGSEYFISNQSGDEFFYASNAFASTQAVLLPGLKGPIALTLSQDGSEVFATGKSRAIFSHQVGADPLDWKKIELNWPASIDPLALAYLGQNRLIAAHPSGLYVSTDLGQSWVLHTLYRSESYAEDSSIFAPGCLLGFADAFFLTSSIEHCFDYDVLGQLPLNHEPTFEMSLDPLKPIGFKFYDAELQETLAVVFTETMLEAGKGSYGFHLVSQASGQVLASGSTLAKRYDIKGVSKLGILSLSRQYDAESKSSSYLTFDGFDGVSFKVSAPIDSLEKAFIFSPNEWVLTTRYSIHVTLDRGLTWKNLQ